MFAVGFWVLVILLCLNCDLGVGCLLTLGGLFEYVCCLWYLLIIWVVWLTCDLLFEFIVVV